MVLIRCMLAIVALAGGVAHDASAQNYPSRPIRVVVPFPPGGTADVVARILAQPLGQALGQALVVDNRAGADGAVAALLVMNALPDGHTLFLASNSPMSAVPTMHRKPPYDPRTDFTAITLIGKFTFFMFVNSAVPAKTLTEFIDYARANPGKLNYGSGNTTAIVSMAQLSLLAKLDMTHVPYKGDAPTTADLIAGRVQSAFMTPVPAFALAKEGKLRILATLLTKRSALAPDVPTMAEAGMPGVSVAPWLGLFAPAKLPKDITTRLSREFNAALRRPEVMEQLARPGIRSAGLDPRGTCHSCQRANRRLGARRPRREDSGRMSVL
jgi:tripartite-type tricarboxylate transporter receptor subunit TctC